MRPGGRSTAPEDALLPRLAAGIARAFLLMYPPSVRRELGASLVGDIRTQMAALVAARGRCAALIRLVAVVASLLANGVAAWCERLAAPPRGFARGISALDFKLGLRMMARHPGLTLIGVLGMSVAIAIGVVFAAAVDIVYATLPFEDGERLVAIESWDLSINNQDYRDLHDYHVWRDELETVEELGAYRTVRRNLIDEDGHAAPVTVAEITASGFRVTGVPPLLGRTLVDEDMRRGAPRVLVIGHDVWRNRFGAAPDIVGRDVRLGAARYSVVGVMPDGFAFPLAHGLWAPFRDSPGAYGPREGPSIRVFGRLAPGATLETAQAELSAIGERLSAEFPDTHELIRPSIIPYTALPWDDMEGVEIPLVAIIVVLLLGVISANVGTLVYARTATRRSELLVRTALGASRSKLVGQLFVEALVIAFTAAALGIAVAGLVIERLNVFIDSLTTGGGAWFWMRFTLSPANIAWALVLALLGALIAGALPALGSTGRRVQTRLQSFSGGSEGGMGRTWTTLIVAQVAVAVAVLPTTVFMAWEMTRYGTARPDFPAEEYLAGFLYVDPGADGDVEELVQQGALRGAERDDAGATDFEARYANLQAELARRLRAELGASGVAYVLSYPGDYPTVRIDVERSGRDPGSRAGDAGFAADDTGPGAGDPVAGLGDTSSGTGDSGSETGDTDETRAGAVATSSVRAGFTRVEPGFFDLLEVTQLAGRRFTRADTLPGARTVMVNRSFVDKAWGGAAAIGRRIRYASGYRAGGVERQPAGTSPDEWYEIVGVVEDFPRRRTEPGQNTAHIYHALAPGGTYPAGLIARLPRNTTEAVQRTRDIAAAVDPTLRFTTLQTLAARLGELQAGQRIAGLALSLITFCVAALSMAGLYALVSHAVVRRRREIGIRRALGGQRGGILTGILARALGQVGAGAALGWLIAYGINAVVGAELGHDGGWFFFGVSVAMMVAGLLAAAGPARRGMRVEPTEALRE